MTLIPSVIVHYIDRSCISQIYAMKLHQKIIRHMLCFRRISEYIKNHGNSVELHAELTCCNPTVFMYADVSIHFIPFLLVTHKSMTGNTKSELRIPAQGVSDDDQVTIANTINDQFVKVSSNIPFWSWCSRGLLTSKRTPTITLSLGCVRWAQNPPKQLAQMEFHLNLWKNLLMSWVHI